MTDPSQTCSPGSATRTRPVRHGAMPGSKVKEALATILEREGFIAGYKVEPNVGKPGPRSRSR